MDRHVQQWIIDMLVHIHTMQHDILNAIADLAGSQNDVVKIAELLERVKAKSKAIQDTLAKTPKIP